MTAFTTFTDSDLAPGKPITSSMMIGLRDNPIAMGERDSTAPQITPPQSQAFTSSGTFTVPSNVDVVEVLVIGGGGGGGGFGTNAPGGGGGAGGMAWERVDVSAVSSVAVTVGGGGSGGGTNTNGSNGGTSSFGSFCSATGGSGGEFGSTSGGASGGAGGVGSGGNLNIAGGGGAGGTLNNGPGGHGGSSFFGSGAKVTDRNGSTLPTDSNCYGSGGHGGSTTSSGLGMSGGDGAGGVVWVRY